MVEGGMKCVKYILFVFNLIFFLCGLSLVIAGVLVFTNLKEFLDIFGGHPQIIPIIIISVGAIIFTIGFFGCCGAYKENYCMMITYAAFLAVLFVLEIGAGITTIALKNQASTLMKTKVKDSVKLYQRNAPKNGGLHAIGNKFWDKIQNELKCCGAENYTDWRNVTDGYPDSCCEREPNCGRAHDASKIYHKGCVDAINRYVGDNLAIVAGIGGGVAFIQVIGIILACCLAKNIRKEYDIY